MTSSRSSAGAAAVIDVDGLNHLGRLIAHIRTDWHAPGIRTALEQALERHPYPLVVVVAVASATDPTARTPAVIPRRCDDGRTGTPTTPSEPTPTPRGARAMHCANCGALVTTDEHVCGVATPGYARQAHAAAVAAIRSPHRPERNPQ